MVNMGFEPDSAPYGGDGGNLDNTVACTNAVQTAGYNFDLSSGGYIAGNPAVVSGGTDPTTMDAGSGPLAIINQTGGARKKRGRKSKRSKKLRRSNKSRLSNKSKKSRSASRSKVKKVVRKSLRKSKKNKRSKSLK
jgi:hypothetical protein